MQLCTCTLVTRHTHSSSLGVQSIKDVSVPAGMLEIDIIEAKNIPKGDYLSDSSPYVQ